MNGIFEPLYDMTDEAVDMMDGAEEARDAGEGRLEARERIAAKETHRERQRRRRDMLLVERLVDEWGETKAFVRGRLRERGASRRLVSVVDRARASAEDAAIELIARVAGKVYDGRISREEAKIRLGGKPAVPHSVGPGTDVRGVAVASVFTGVARRMRGVFERLRHDGRWSAEIEPVIMPPGSYGDGDESFTGARGSERFFPGPIKPGKMRYRHSCGRCTEPIRPR